MLSISNGFAWLIYPYFKGCHWQWGIYIYVETYPHVRSNLLHLVPVRPSSVSLPRGFRQKWDGKRRIAKCHYSTTKRCYESCSYIDLGLTNQPLVWMYICCLIKTVHGYTWWRHQMETFSALLAICAGNTDHRWIPHTNASDAELWCFLWSVPWIKGWVNNREAGVLRGHRAHYDVIVMSEITKNRKETSCLP